MSGSSYDGAIRAELTKALTPLSTRLKAKLDQSDRPRFLKDEGRAEIEALLPSLKLPILAIDEPVTWPAFQSIDAISKEPLNQPYRALHARIPLWHAGDVNFALDRYLRPALDGLAAEDKGMRYFKVAEEEVLEAWYGLTATDNRPGALAWITSSANEVVRSWNECAQQLNSELFSRGTAFVKGLVEEYQLYYGPIEPASSPEEDSESAAAAADDEVAMAASTPEVAAEGTAMGDFFKEPLSPQQLQQLGEVVSGLSVLQRSPSPDVAKLSLVVQEALGPLVKDTKDYLIFARKCDKVLLTADLRLVPSGTRDITLWLVPSRTSEPQERLALRRLNETLWSGINSTNAKYEGHSGHGSRLPELFTLHRERFAQWIQEVDRISLEFDGPPGSALFLLVEGFWTITEALFRMVDSGTGNQNSLLDDWLDFASDHLKLAQRDHRRRMPKGGGVSQIKLFISHSSADKPLAEAFSTLVMASFEGLREQEIRCTSVGGHKLATGAHSSTTLKADLANASEVVGILTKASLASSYVLFELGAAWGREASVRTLLGPDATHADLRAPLSELNVTRLTERGDVLTLLDELAEGLKIQKRSAAAIDRAVNTFLTHVTPAPGTGSP